MDIIIAFIAACFVEILLVVSHPVRARSAGDTFQACPQCCSKVSQANERLGNINFDDLCLAAFNGNSLKMDLEKIPCTSVNARKHMDTSPT